MAAALARQSWPVDPSGKNAFYGNPGVGGPDPTWKAQNLVSYTVPWTGKSVLVHTKVRASLDRVLTQYWNEIGHDQSIIARYGLADVETYNYRANRNNPASLSNHSYGIACDFAPSHNPNGSHWVDGGAMLPRRLIELFKFEGWRWGGDFSSTKDPMHFEAVFDQHHDQPPVPAPASVTATQTAPVSVTLPVTPGLLVPSTGTAPAPLVALAEAAAMLVARQLIQASPQGAQIAAELRAQAVIGREIADLVIALLDKVAPVAPIAPPAPLPQPQAPPIAFPLPGGPLPDFLQPTAPAAPSTHIQTGITATVFGGSGDRNTSAYDGHLITDTEPGCALPCRFTGPRPLVSVKGPNGQTATVPIVDVGPWNTNDPYWTTGSRPQAESGTDMHGRHTNLAGIDLTPATAKAVGISGKGKVDWWFANQSAKGTAPMTMPSDFSQVFAGSKKWYQSTGIWGAIIAAASPLLGGFLHVTISQDQAGQLAQALSELGNVVQVAGPVVGGIVAGIGRVKATTTIGN